MRKLSELIVLVRGGGEVGSAVAYRLFRCHFRVCIAEIDSPLSIHRGCSFSDAIFDSEKTVEGLTAEKVKPTLEGIYRAWRNETIPVVADAELCVKPLLKPDVMVNAMMLKRKTNTTLKDASLVIGIGPGFTAGDDVHLVIEPNPGINLGRVLMDGCAEDSPVPETGTGYEGVVFAEDNGVFTALKTIGDTVLAGDEIGRLNDLSITAPVSGILRGMLRDQTKVLSHCRLADIDAKGDKTACFSIRDDTRAIAGGVLEAILLSLNVEEPQ